MSLSQKSSVNIKKWLLSKWLYLKRDSRVSQSIRQIRTFSWISWIMRWNNFENSKTRRMQSVSQVMNTNKSRYPRKSIIFLLKNFSKSKRVIADSSVCLNRLRRIRSNNCKQSWITCPPQPIRFYMKKSWRRSVIRAVNNLKWLFGRMRLWVCSLIKSEIQKKSQRNSKLMCVIHIPNNLEERSGHLYKYKLK